MNFKQKVKINGVLLTKDQIDGLIEMLETQQYEISISMRMSTDDDLIYEMGENLSICKQILNLLEVKKQTCELPSKIVQFPSK